MSSEKTSPLDSFAGRLRRAVHPFELVAWGGALAVSIALRLAGVPIGWSAVEYMLDALVPRLPGLIAIGVALQVAAELVRRRSPLAWARAALAPSGLFLLARLWLAAMAVVYAYSWLKVSVPYLNRSLHDEALWRLDRTLHLGVSPSIFGIELFGGGAARWLDFWYALWITSVLVTQSALFLARRPAMRRNFALACALLWLAGGAVYALAPAVGPVFFQPELFEDVARRLPYTTKMGGELWSHYAALVAARDGGGGHRLLPFLAVAAMPSLHVGAHAMFTFWARRHARRWVLPAAFATAATFAGSLVTGWHYAVDGYVGILLGWGAVALADRLEPIAPVAVGTAPPAGVAPEPGEAAAGKPLDLPG